MTEQVPSDPPAIRPRKRRRAGIGLWFLIGMIFIVGLLGFAALAVSGKPLKLPVWAVAEVEARLNNATALAMSELSLSVGAIELMVDGDDNSDSSRQRPALEFRTW